MAASIHDIGKTTIPAEILNKPGALNDIEMSLVKNHAYSGYEILKNINFGDPIAEIVRAKVSIMVIGERPGLSAADSLGLYITCSPQAGTPDSKRNCISNIRKGGLESRSAADGAASLVMDMIRTGISGVGLQDALAGLPSN